VWTHMAEAGFRGLAASEEIDPLKGAPSRFALG